MPFTLAHPAVVLPLKRYPRYFSMTALVLGSMSPDFEYFINFAVKRTVGHTYAGIFVMDIPLVILFAVMFHHIVKVPFIRHLPSPLSEWYYPYTLSNRRIPNPMEILAFLYSALIGITTHILWDGFTHANGLFVQKISLLNEAVTIGVYKLPIYKLLQHGSSLLGLYILIAYLFSIRSMTKNIGKISDRRKFKFWTTTLFITIILLIAANMTYKFDGIIHLFGKLVTSSISSVVVGVIASCIIFRRKL